MRWAVAVAIAIMLGGCGGSSPSSTSGSAKRQLFLSSPAFRAGGPLPREYTCDGGDVSPPLRWSGVPAGTGELALTMRDPDAPGGNFVHWRVTGIAPTTTGFASGRLPAGVVQGRNDFGTVGYRGPCPPRGALHHYVITLTAIAGRSELAVGSLVGSYARG